MDQRKWMFGWLLQGLRSLYAGKWSFGQALALAGPPDCGKTLLAQLIKEMMGGTWAFPYKAMVGETGFNVELFESMFLLIDDEAPATDIRSRKRFAAEIKQITVVPGGRMEAKHKNPMALRPLWRLMICLNLEPDSLMVLPPLDDDIADKVMLIQAYKRPLPGEIETEDDKDMLWNTLTGELPAFLWWLFNEFNLPSSERNSRYGVRTWHHPKLFESLEELSPQRRLLNYIDRALFKHGHVFKGSATDIEVRLKADDSALTRDEIRRVPQGSWLGRYLEKLSKRFPRRFAQHRDEEKRIWTIYSGGLDAPFEDNDGNDSKDFG